jgi:ABC-2 type transport system permease protein
MSEPEVATQAAETPYLGRARGFVALVHKESYQIVRDPSSILIAFVLPIILLFIFGYGVSLDATRTRVGLVVESTTSVTQSLAASFQASPYFEVINGRDRRDFEQDLVIRRVHGIIVIPSTFAGDYAASDTPKIQVIVERFRSQYRKFRSKLRPRRRSHLDELAGSRIDRRRPDHYRKSAVLVQRRADQPQFPRTGRDRDRNDSRRHAFDVSGDRARMGTRNDGGDDGDASDGGRIARGKDPALFHLGSRLDDAVRAARCLPLRRAVQRLAPGALCAVGGIPGSGAGTGAAHFRRHEEPVSSLATRDTTAFMPAFLLSGFLFEINSMPRVIQWITLIVPARYLIASLQTVFLAGDIWPMFMPAIAIMLLMGAALFAMAARCTRKRIG